ncbi:MAG TPA: response regulator transcription factor [Symbiobacteriaceae bacterium]|nr:response regulator transcription factor [Symbiobacteriaceae bacterium]
MIRVLLVDDQRLMRDGMRTLLSLEPDLEVTGEAGNGLEGVQKALAERPDVVLMDIRMPGMNGVEATREIRRALPETRVLVLTTFDDDELVMDALLEGAAGYLTKDLPAEEIAESIRKVCSGGVVMPPPIAAKVVAELARRNAAVRTPPKEEMAVLAQLTDREQEVLRLLGQGYSNKEVGEALFITEGTAKNHVSNVIEKLGLRDRTQAALWAVRHGL